MTNISITPADSTFSKCIRERSNWTCEKCGVKYEPPTTGLQCAHIFGRRNKAVRFEPLNAFALCFACHQYYTANPMNFGIFVHNKLGDKYDVLLEKSNDISLGKEITRGIKDGDIAKHFRAEHERMIELRAQGVTGRIEFAGYI